MRASAASVARSASRRGDTVDRWRDRASLLFGRWRRMQRGERWNVTLYVLTGVSMLALTVEFLAGPDTLPTEVTSAPAAIGSSGLTPVIPSSTTTLTLPPVTEPVAGPAQGRGPATTPAARPAEPGTQANPQPAPPPTDPPPTDPPATGPTADRATDHQGAGHHHLHRVHRRPPDPAVVPLERPAGERRRSSSARSRHPGGAEGRQPQEQGL